MDLELFKSELEPVGGMIKFRRTDMEDEKISRSPLQFHCSVQNQRLKLRIIVNGKASEGQIVADSCFKSRCLG